MTAQRVAISSDALSVVLARSKANQASEKQAYGRVLMPHDKKGHAFMLLKFRNHFDVVIEVLNSASLLLSSLLDFLRERNVGGAFRDGCHCSFLLSLRQ